MDNFIKYGSLLPPEVNFSTLAECSIPIHIFSAGHDQWAASYDTDYLYRQISQVYSVDYTSLTRVYSECPHERYHHNFPNASHLSFFIGKDMNYTYKVDQILERHGKDWIPKEKEANQDIESKINREFDAKDNIQSSDMTIITSIK